MCLPRGYFISPCSAGHGRQQPGPFDRPASHPQSTRPPRRILGSTNHSVRDTRALSLLLALTLHTHTAKGLAINQSTSRHQVSGVKNWLALHSILAATCPPWWIGAQAAQTVTKPAPSRYCVSGRSRQCGTPAFGRACPPRRRRHG